MSTTLRIIDANLNRAREALRVMEEYARFVLDDASLSGAIKQARHELRQTVPDELRELLVRPREIVGDVGRSLSTPSESVRESAADVAVAAGRRLSEALRALEEYGKTVDPAFAARVERLRYSGYELERRVQITAGARERLRGVGLYVLITEALCRGDWLATAEAALRGGADCLQLREKQLPDRELLARARRLAALCREHGAMLIINDRPDIAAVSGADGVHLGQDDLSVSDARRVLPATALVGKSTHTEHQIAAAIDEAPDYIAVGPMFSSGTKPQDHIAGPSTLAWASQRTGLPLVAIGGITEERVSEIHAAAPCIVSVCSAVIGVDDPGAACARFASLAAHRGYASCGD